ncbi:MAG TPA: 16S rRNA (guanine(527)-N(7))-methyltransferase RsmG [Pyrinomonadaceae bacterium]
MKHAPFFDVRLSEALASQLRDYYEQVMRWNSRLHLVAPCTPREFATRHVLESLLALPHISEGARLADVGSGAGLPIIPILIARPDLRSTLIESSPKKAIFLRETLQLAGARDRANVLAERFENTLAPEADFTTCRALDRFTELFSKLFEWSVERSTLLLWGGETLREQIEKISHDYIAVRIPESERRFLFILEKKPKGQSQA